MKWQELPWEDLIIKTNIITKWKDVDVKHINYLHANFNTESGKFENIENVK